MMAQSSQVMKALAALGLVGVATAVKMLIDPAWRVDSVFAPYMLTSAAATWLFGRRAGYAAVLGAGLVYVVFFIEPRYQFQFPSSRDAIQAIIFLSVAALIVEIVHQALQAQQRARDATSQALTNLERAKRSEEKLEASLNSLKDPIAVFRTLRDDAGQINDFHIEYLNDACTNRDPDYASSQIQLGRRLSEFPLATRFGLMDRLSRVAQSGQRFDTELEIRPEGASFSRWFEFHATRLGDRVIAHWHEITVRKKAEHALAESEQRYHAILDTVPHIFWTAAADGSVDYLSSHFQRVTGLAPEKGLDQAWVELVHPEDRDRVQSIWNAARSEQREMRDLQLRLMRYDGAYRWMSASAVPLRDENGAPTRWFGTATDIHERRTAEEAIRRSETRFRKLYESNQVGIVFYERAGRLSDPNDAFLEMLGYTRRQFEETGLNWRVLTPPEWAGADAAAIAELVTRGRCRPFEKEYIARDGSRVPILVTASNLDDNDSSHGVSVIVDLRPVKLVEAALRDSQARLLQLTQTLEQRISERTFEAEQRSQQLRALAMDLAETESRERKRLAQLLHDHFQQLVSAAKLKAGIVRRRLEDPQLIESTKQIESLLEEAINASRSLATELSPPVLNDAGLLPAFEWLARKMEKDYGLAVTFNSHPDAEPVSEQVRMLIFECVRELLFNVVKHAQTHEATLSAKVSPDGLLSVSVCDSGSGFNVNCLQSAQSSSDGSFGLFSIRERLTLIGGLMKLSSEIGKGTCIELVVPASTQPGGGTPIEPPTDAVTLLRTTRAIRSDCIRVVVADDHRLFREGLINLLSQESGVKVIGEASDGEEAIELCHTLLPDVLIVDVTMPRLNGVQVTARLSREIPQLQIIGLSMHERDDMADAMRSAGAVAYLTKGGPSEQLLNLIRSMLPPVAVATSETPHGV